jgi:hypothetical protein
MPNYGQCYRCEKFGHLIADCPELQPAASKAEHERRIALYLQRLNNWLDGTGGVKWTPEQKTRAITTENAMEASRKTGARN